MSSSRGPPSAGPSFTLPPILGSCPCCCALPSACCLGAWPVIPAPGRILPTTSSSWYNHLVSGALRCWPGCWSTAGAAPAPSPPPPFQGLCGSSWQNPTPNCSSLPCGVHLHLSPLRLCRSFTSLMLLLILITLFTTLFQWCNGSGQLIAPANHQRAAYPENPEFGTLIGPGGRTSRVTEGSIKGAELSFTADDARGFILAGERISLLSGSLHYWRVPREYWEERLLALREMGLNTVETYIPWSLHQPRPTLESISFEGNLDLEHFLDLARGLGLMVILRPGPYICSEMDLGGLPSWLLAKGASLRSADATYLGAVDKWWGRLIPLAALHQVSHGGSVIMVQVENEFGHLRTDGSAYLGHLVRKLRELGIEVPLITSDGMDPRQIYWGAHVGSKGKETPLRTVNFGAALNHRARPALEMLAAVQPGRPQMAMELWCGWFDSWGASEHAAVPTEDVLEDLEEVLLQGASFNLYMFHGGTNWGFTTGSLMFPASRPQYVTTSYDYDAPLSEGGHPTAKYLAIQRRLEVWRSQNPVMGRLGLQPLRQVEPLKPRQPKVDLGRVEMEEWLPLLDCLDTLPQAIKSDIPLQMEQLQINDGGGQSHGFILYKTNISSAPQPLEKVEVVGMRDRAQMWVTRNKGQDKGMRLSVRSKGVSWERETEVKPKRLSVKVNGEGSDLWLELLVENMGRVFMTHDFKHNLQELRGLESVRAIPGSVPIHGWEMYPFEFDKEYVLGKLASSTCWMAANGGVGTSRPRSGGISHPVGQPVVYRGTFYVPEDPTVPVCDQRIDTGLLFGNKQQPMWNKGAVFVNGFNLGRFWTAKGPQRTLYLPSPLLRRGENHLVLLELHSYDGHPMGRPSVELLAD